jgi:hypothetical protein
METAFPRKPARKDRSGFLWRSARGLIRVRVIEADVIPRRSRKFTRKEKGPGGVGVEALL